MDFKDLVNQRLKAITDSLNTLNSNAKKIDDLPKQATLVNQSKIHVSRGGVSEYIEVSQLVSLLSNLNVPYGRVLIFKNASNNNPANKDTLEVNDYACGYISDTVFLNFGKYLGGDKTVIGSYLKIAHTHLSTDITDLNESVEDIIGTKIKAGANTNIVYNDTTGETTISVVVSNFDRIIKASNIELVGNNPKVLLGMEWQINGVLYTNNVDVLLPTPLCAAGNKRHDIIVATTGNTFVIKQGVETTGTPVKPTPNVDTLEVSNYIISDVAITTPPINPLPPLAKVATTGSWGDLLNKPTNIADDTNVLHKTGNESFTGIKTAVNTNDAPVGFDISNNRTARERATNIWQNLLNGEFNIWQNLSTGVFNFWSNTSTGVLTKIVSTSLSTGDLFQFFKDTVKTASINHLGHFTSNKFINPTGQGFLKANGDIDTNTYKLDTPNLNQFSTTAFSGVAQKGYVDIPLGTAVVGKLDVTIYTGYEGENISASASAIIDVLCVGGTFYRNELKHKEVNPLITSKCQIIGLISVNNSFFLRINKLSAVENAVAVSITKTGFNPNNGYNPTIPLPFVQDDTVVATDVLNVKNVYITSYTISPNDWVNVDKTLLVKGSVYNGIITLAPANLTKGLITRVVNDNINTGGQITVKGALTVAVTITYQRTASFISDGFSNFQI